MRRRWQLGRPLCFRFAIESAYDVDLPEVDPDRGCVWDAASAALADAGLALAVARLDPPLAVKGGRYEPEGGPLLVLLFDEDVEGSGHAAVGQLQDGGLVGVHDPAFRCEDLSGRSAEVDGLAVVVPADAVLPPGWSPA